jgi:hypothetical protein
MMSRKNFFCCLLAVLLILTMADGGEARRKKRKKSPPPPTETTQLPFPGTDPASDKQPQPDWSSALTIAGPPLVTPKQAVRFIKKNSPGAQLNCSVEDLVRFYYEEAALEGIRPDVALSQALLETGFFRYGGAVKPQQNNFCGLGSVSGGQKGASFPTPAIGVRAHIQHLLAYSSKRTPQTPIVDPRYSLVKSNSRVFGACRTWDDLDGRWAAADVPYGARIRSVYRRMLES